MTYTSTTDIVLYIIFGILVLASFFAAYYYAKK